MTSPPIDPVPVARLRWTCTDAEVAAGRAAPPADAPAAHGVVGQRRAVEAIATGLDITSPGYHIFVTGAVGSGRAFSVETILRQSGSRCAVPRDRVYVHNFASPTHPRLITLPMGRGRALKAAMDELVEDARRAVSSLFDDEQLSASRDRITERFRKREQALFTEFEGKTRDRGLAPVTIQRGSATVPQIFPLVDGKPMPFEQVEAEPEALEKVGGAEKLAELREAAGEVQKELESLIKEAQSLAKQMVREVRQMERSVAERALASLIADVAEEFDDDVVRRHLGEVRTHIIDNLDRFRHDPSDDAPGTGGEGNPLAQLAAAQADADPFRIYRVNCILDCDRDAGPPIVVEQNPTHTNVFGTIEREQARPGEWTSDFMTIRSGAMLAADGGFLVLNCRDLLAAPGVWRTLVRTLKSGTLEIQPPETALFTVPSALKPEPVPINLKVILIGDEGYYRLFDYHEEDFHKVFKIKAEFDTTIPRTEARTHEFMHAVDTIALRESLHPVADSGHAAVLELAVRRAGRRSKLHTRFGDIADIVREAHHIADRAGGRQIDRDAVETAIQAQRDRHRLLDDKIHEALIDDLLMVATAGTRIGQVNGLTVTGIGPFPFGKPARITCTVGAGREGIINIEREARLSGSSHDKGVMILAGYLRALVGRRTPIALTASIAFEQSYGGIDGDSATVAEVCALVSAITQTPIRQDLAVTGSMNQLGDVQPIGGVNQKVEGFFRRCRDRGLTGTQGCIIPVANIDDLMLDPDVVEAAAEGRFQLYAVSRVEQALALFTGMEVGEPDGRGRFDAGTLGRRLADEVEKLAAPTRGTNTETVKIQSIEPHTDTPPAPPSDPPPPGPR
jgi:predicted ATP-dependent protease